MINNKLFYYLTGIEQQDSLGKLYLLNIDSKKNENKKLSLFKSV